MLKRRLSSLTLINYAIYSGDLKNKGIMIELLSENYGYLSAKLTQANHSILERFQVSWKYFFLNITVIQHFSIYSSLSKTLYLLCRRDTNSVAKYIQGLSSHQLDLIDQQNNMTIK